MTVNLFEGSRRLALALKVLWVIGILVLASIDSEYKEGLYLAVGGWIAAGILERMIGWVVRGFLGIPRGQDRWRDQVAQ